MSQTGFRKRVKVLKLDSGYQDLNKKKKERRELSLIEKKLRRYTFSKLPNTRKYLIASLTKDPNFLAERGIILKEDLIQRYYETRKSAGKRIFNYDFSNVPDIIPSRKAKFHIYVNEISVKTKEVIGDWETNYENLITKLSDNSSCAGMVVAEKTSMTTQEFIQKSEEKFGRGKFDYSKVDYINYRTPITLKCLRCGEWFEQTPSEHLNGTGHCPTCAKELSGIAKRKTTEEFISELIDIFGEDTFDFSETEYVHAKHPVKIREKSTGIVYERMPYALLEGNDPRCGNSIGEYLINEWLIQNNIEFSSEVRKLEIFPENPRGIFIDFITSDNLWIECNGIQHYIKRFFNRSDEEFRRQLKRDKAIVDYCKENKIKLLVIPYTLCTRDKIFEILERVIINGESTDFIEYPEIEKLENNE